MSQANLPMYQDSGLGPPSGNYEPPSLEDYNRTMLEYTQRQMSSFVDMDGNWNNSSRSSQNSGSSNSANSGSGCSTTGVITRQANGPPTSAGAAAEAMARQNAKDAENGHNAHSSGL